MIIERKHYFIGAFILAFSLIAQPFSIILIQNALTPTLVEVLEKMKKDPMEDFYSAQSLDEDKFAVCLADENIENRILEEQKLGESLGVTGTPSTFIGKKDTSGNIVLYKDAISGALPKQSVIDAINKKNKVLSATVIKNENLHVYGSIDAETFLVEFSDLECPYCANFHPTITDIVDSSDGKIAMIYKHFPLTSIHPNAVPLAISAECVSAQKGDIGFFDFVEANFAQMQ